MPHFHVISGCSGGGKSSLLAELGQRGHSIVPEPGRRIVAKEQAGDGAALPWSNPAAFARRAIALSLRDLEENRSAESVVFFDRGLIDAACALLHTSPGKNEEDRVLALCAQHRYQPVVFMTPPWPEIYVNDAQRKHDLYAAVAEYERLWAFYPKLGYRLIELPRNGIAFRADFVEAHIGKT